MKFFSKTKVEPMQSLETKQAPPKPQGGNKWKHLDGVRGWAALCVFVIHFGYQLYPEVLQKNDKIPPYQSFLFRLVFWPGNFAVTVFFILSGRVLCSSFLKSKKPKSLAGSFIRRPIRLWFPVMVSVFVHWILASLNVYEPLLNQAKTLMVGTDVWWDYAKVGGAVNFFDIFYRSFYLFLPGFPSPPFPIISVYWTLPVELVNSYIVYVLVFLQQFVKNGKYPLYAFLTIICALNYLASFTAPFIVGLVLAELHQDGHFSPANMSRKMKLSIQVIAVVIGAIFIASEYWYTYPFDGSDIAGRSVWLVFFCKIGFHLPTPDWPNNPFIPIYNQLNINFLVISSCLMLFVELNSGAQWLFGLPPFEFLGKISFGLYMMHPIVMSSFGSFMVTRLLPGMNYDLAIGIVIGSTLVVTILTGYGFYHIADEPSVRLGKYVEQYLFEDDTPQVSAPTTVGVDDKIQKDNQGSPDTVVNYDVIYDKSGSTPDWQPYQNTGGIYNHFDDRYSPTHYVQQTANQNPTNVIDQYLQPEDFSNVTNTSEHIDQVSRRKTQRERADRLERSRYRQARE